MNGYQGHFADAPEVGRNTGVQWLPSFLPHGPSLGSLEPECVGERRARVRRPPHEQALPHSGPGSPTSTVGFLLSMPMAAVCGGGRLASVYRRGRPRPDPGPLSSAQWSPSAGSPVWAPPSGLPSHFGGCRRPCASLRVGRCVCTCVCGWTVCVKDCVGVCRAGGNGVWWCV